MNAATEKSSGHILLAPMEGLVDFVLRDVLTRVGGVDRCVSEFIRVSGTLLPNRAFIRVMPELLNGGKTFAGVPVRGQLLGSDATCLAENAARLASLGPTGVVRSPGTPATKTLMCGRRRGPGSTNRSRSPGIRVSSAVMIASTSAPSTW